MKTFRNILTVLSLLVFAASHAHAQAIGDIISYQGKLTNPDGTPLTNGTYSVTLKVYENNVAKTTQTMPVATLGGVFSTFLTVGALQFDPAKQYQLGVTYNGTETKHNIASVPVAQAAKTANVANKANSSTTAVTADNLTASDWIPYVPAWTALLGNPLLGNGYIEGRYIKIGKTVHFVTHMTFGSTTTFGSGAFEISLPMPARDDNGRFPGTILQNGVAWHTVVGVAKNNTKFLLMSEGNGRSGVEGNYPWTLSSNDSITVSGTYEALN